MAPLDRQRRGHRDVVGGERTPHRHVVRQVREQVCAEPEHGTVRLATSARAPPPERHGNRRLTVGRSVDLPDCHVDDPAFFICAFPAVLFLAGGRPGRCRSSFAASAAATATSDSSRAISPSRTTSLRLTKCPAWASRRRTRSIRSASAGVIEKVLTVVFEGAVPAKSNFSYLRKIRLLL